MQLITGGLQLEIADTQGTRDKDKFKTNLAYVMLCRLEVSQIVAARRD